MAAVTLTAEERDAVFAQLAAGLSLTFLQGLVSFGKGEDQRQLLDGYRGVIDEALLELRGTKFVRFWVDAFSLYDDLREDDCESYPLSVPAGSLQRVIRWVVQIGETRFPLLARAIEGQVTADLADDVLDAYKACLRVLDVIDSASKAFGTSPVATSAAFGGSRGGR
jgi:hypothetical protein